MRSLYIYGGLAALLLAACDLGFGGDSGDDKSSSSGPSSSASASSSSAATSGGWELWNVPADNQIQESQSIVLDESQHFFVLESSGGYCEDSVYQEGEPDTLLYEQNGGELLVWGKEDCEAMRFTGSNGGVQGSWTFADAVAIPGGAVEGCDGESGPEGLGLQTVTIGNSQLTLEGTACPMDYMGEMFDDAGTVVQKIDCNRALLIAQGDTMRMRVEQGGMEGMNLSLYHSGASCSLESGSVASSEQCSLEDETWTNFASCLMEKGFPLWGMDMEFTPCELSGSGICLGLADAASCAQAGGQAVESCPAGYHMTCGEGSASVYVYNPEITSCEGVP